MSVRVEGVAFVNRALTQVSRDIQAGARKEIQAIGSLVAHDAEVLALTSIGSMHRSPQWSNMRVGQNNDLVYVVPRQRGARRGKQKRSNLAPLMLRTAMRPARDRNAAEIESRFDALVSSVCANFNG